MAAFLCVYFAKLQATTMKYSFWIGLFCVSASVNLLNAQVPKLAMFYENASWQNPAILAGNEGVEIGLYDHLQNAGTGGVVNTLLLYGEKRQTNQGYGVNYFGDYVGLLQQHALQLSYAHTLLSGENTGTLSLGVTAGGYLSNNTAGILNESTEHLIGVLGAAYRMKDLLIACHVGRRAEISINNVAGVLAQYKFTVTEALQLTPVLNLNIVGPKVRSQAGLVVSVYQLADIGLMYNDVSAGTDLNFGLNLFKNYRIGYSVVGLGNSVFTQYSQEFFLAWQPGKRTSEAG